MNWKALRTVYLVLLLLFVAFAVLFVYPVYKYLKKPVESPSVALLSTSPVEPREGTDEQAASIDPRSLLEMSSEMIPTFEGMVKRVAPKSVEARVGLGVLYQFKGMRAEAVRCYKIAIELDPRSPDAHYRLGTAYQELGLERDAVAEYEETARINPKYVYAYFSLAAIRQNQGRWDDAERLYQRILEVRPKDYQAYNNLGIVYEAQGLHEKALKAYQTAYELNPKDPVVKENLTQVKGQEPLPAASPVEQPKAVVTEIVKARSSFKPEKVSTIFLKNKQILSGEILEKDSGGLWFGIDRGAKVYVSTAEIDRVEEG